MKVEIWSDVVCPWCYIGKRRFEHALERFEGADEVEIVWRSFQLNPAHPKGLREAHDESLARKLGTTVEQVHRLNERVVSLAAAEGLDYHFETYVTINTFDAHRVTHLAKALGLGLPIHERLLRAQLVEGEVLDDPDTLVRLAAEVGVPEAETRRVLETDAYASAVEADIAEAHAIGINGVPFFVIDRRYGISGAQSADLFLSALETARSDAASEGNAPGDAAPA
ncbi:MAG TPA: DsbA family oxidoreductase [Candidatus Limnocylindrales bacterium]|nr:DsbA family oxidoreductase [Candidatus Limnocylindrales bacterium]